MERLAEAVGYPERIPEGSLSFTFLVDGAEIEARETGGWLRLSTAIADDPGKLPALAEFAAGRMLREDAALAWDESRGCAFLWQEADAGAGAHALVRLFETFADSCDWWRARAGAGGGGEREPEPREMMIRP